MGTMSTYAEIKARRLRIDLWVYVPTDEEMPSARTVADGIVEGLGDAWFDLDDGDPHTVSTSWQAEYVGEEQIVPSVDP
jgi:hypothetical protein